MSGNPPSQPSGESEIRQIIIEQCRKLLSEPRTSTAIGRILGELREILKQLSPHDKGRAAYVLRIDIATRYLEAEEPVAAQYEIRLLLNMLESHFEEPERSKKQGKNMENDPRNPGSIMAISPGDFIRQFCYELVGYSQPSKPVEPPTDENSASVVY